MKIKHPTFGYTLEVPANSVKDWAAQGWIIIKEPKPKPKKSEEAESSEAA